MSASRHGRALPSDIETTKVGCLGIRVNASLHIILEENRAIISEAISRKQLSLYGPRHKKFEMASSPYKSERTVNGHVV